MAEPHTPSGAEAPSRRRRGKVFAAVAAAWILGWVVLIATVYTVDGEEYEVLDRVVETLFPENEFTIVESTRSSAGPCWFWCEDYVRHVDLHVDIEPVADMTPAEVCDHVGRAIEQMAGTPPIAPDRPLPNRACEPALRGFEVDGREVTVTADVGDASVSRFRVYLRNESVRRAFLPQCPFGCE